MEWATALLRGWLSELRVLYALAMHPVSGDTHKARLESFYGAQAADYDVFRKRLLKGREELISELQEHKGDARVWVDLGGGTGANLEMMGDSAVRSFERIYLVDLCAPLLEVARKRCAEHGWDNVVVVEGDATSWQPEEGLGSVDVLSFSYSLTMIPDWYTALEHAAKLLRPGSGLLGIVDFYVARKHPANGMASHSWLVRNFWPVWFANDDVRLSSDHVPYLQAHFDAVALVEAASAVPYIGALMPRVPYYRFLGRPKAKCA